MIPFVDLKAQYQMIQDEVHVQMQDVLNRTNFILGDAVVEFEKKFATFCDAAYCVGVASGTDALHLSLKALGVGPGDEVIVPANTFVATVLAVSYAGARPVLVDVEPHSYNMDLELLQKRITPKTKAIIPVHLYGRPVDMNRLCAIARHHGITIVEDDCQAHGAMWQGRKVGSFGLMGCFSFYPGKNLGAYGDGGAVVTSDEKLANTLRMLRNYGSPKKYSHDFIGFNSRLDTIQASVLNVKLKYLDDWNKKRFQNAKLYNHKLESVGDIVVPDLDGVNSHVFHLYVIRTKKRDELLRFLNDHQVQAGIHYPIPIYRLKAYEFLGENKNDFPVTEQFSQEILSLPMFAELTETQIDEVVGLIKEFFNR
ncbi:MAG: DegT/DnrJ/EryC1/StrS family aminotransferase [Candidatus Omnitrophota bacterium]